MGILMKTIEAAAVAAALWVSTASAEESAAAHSRATIERQFEAFARDDAEAAYALADPTIKQMFVDPDHFLAMVRDRYAPVYRHRSVEFGDVRGIRRRREPYSDHRRRRQCRMDRALQPEAGGERRLAHFRLRPRAIGGERDLIAT